MKMSMRCAVAKCLSRPGLVAEDINLAHVEQAIIQYSREDKLAPFDWITYYNTADRFLRILQESGITVSLADYESNKELAEYVDENVVNVISGVLANGSATVKRIK